jgi:superoxide dismutase
MKQQELKTDIIKKLDDVNEKIQELKNSQDTKSAKKPELQNIMNQLETIRGKILMQYHTIMNTQNEEDVKLPELEKNIYKSFNSFESAYSKAGSLMKQSKFSSRDRSVDFNNPPGTK